MLFNEHRVSSTVKKYRCLAVKWQTFGLVRNVQLGMYYTTKPWTTYELNRLGYGDRLMNGTHTGWTDGRLCNGCVLCRPWNHSRLNISIESNSYYFYSKVNVFTTIHFMYKDRNYFKVPSVNCWSLRQRSWNSLRTNQWSMIHFSIFEKRRTPTDECM